MDAGDLDDLPELGLSDDVFAEDATPPEASAVVEDAPVVEDEEPSAEVEAEAEAEVDADVEADSQGEADEPTPPRPSADEPVAEAEDEEPSA